MPEMMLKSRLGGILDHARQAVQDLRDRAPAIADATPISARHLAFRRRERRVVLAEIADGRASQKTCRILSIGTARPLWVRA